MLKVLVLFAVLAMMCVLALPMALLTLALVPVFWLVVLPVTLVAGTVAAVAYALWLVVSLPFRLLRLVV
jgi:hypothetical protein